MTTINPVTGFSFFGNNNTPTGEINSTEKQQADFMDLLLSQLQKQDPLEPVSDQEMMMQFAQLTMVQELQKLTGFIEKLSEGNSVSYAAGLIGKSVEASVGLRKIEGTVESVEINGKEIILTINDEQLPLSAVTKITQPEDEAAAVAG